MHSDIGLKESDGITFTTESTVESLDSKWSLGYIGGYNLANNATANGFPGGIVFKTKPANGNPDYNLTQRMVIDANGNVGIGTTDPKSGLDVSSDFHIGNIDGYWSSTVGKGIYMKFGTGGMGEAGYIQSIDRSNTTNKYPLEFTASKFGFSGGNVGIGTISPDHPLTISSSVYGGMPNSYTIVYRGGVAHGHDGSRYKSAFFSGGLSCAGVYVYSDKRIKSDIEKINDNTALDIVNRIESYEYYYKDPLHKNKKKTIGFIAQEVRDILPNASDIIKNFIPDELLSITDPNWETISDDKHKLTIDNLDLSGNHTGNCRFYLSDDLSGNNEVCKEIKVEDDKHSFIFEKKWNNVFFYGKEINDFHTIDKAQIFALHHSAIQELSRQNDNKTQEITELKTENKELKEKLQTMEADMILIKHKLGL